MDGNTQNRTNTRTRKVHFNFIDVLLIALILLFFFIVFFNAFDSMGETKREVVVVVRMTAEDVTENGKMKHLPEAGAKVLKLNEDESYGVLFEEYQRGSDILKMKIKTSLAEGDLTSKGTRFLIGNKVDFRVGTMAVVSGEVIDVWEVTDNEGT